MRSATLRTTLFPKTRLPTSSLRPITIASSSNRPHDPRIEQHTMTQTIPISTNPTRPPPPDTPLPTTFFNKHGYLPSTFYDTYTLSPTPDEYSKSGGDFAVAENAASAFSSEPHPFEEKELAGRGNVVNPLEVSPASPEYSAVVDETVFRGVEGGRLGSRWGTVEGGVRKGKVVGYLKLKDGKGNIGWKVGRVGESGDMGDVRRRVRF